MKEPVMLKGKYNIADLNIAMTLYYDRTKKQAKSYIKCDWDVDKADGIIDLDCGLYDKMYREGIQGLTCNDIEYMYTGALFNRILIDHNGCMLHSSAVVVDGYAYLFSADSGTGKSTHTQLWLKHFGDRAFIINDDKPAIRFINGEWYVYGTPWSGKTNQNVNARAKLGAIVFLERDNENWIKEISTKEALPKFFKQTIRKIQKAEKMELVLNIMSGVLSENPLYRMGCNISDDAVEVAYEKIRRV